MSEEQKLLRMDSPWTWLAAAPDESIPLDQAALLIARDEYPQLDVADYLRRLRLLEADLHERVHAQSLPDEPLTRIVALNNYLFDDQGFVGEIDPVFGLHEPEVFGHEGFQAGATDEVVVPLGVLIEGIFRPLAGV